MKPFLGINLTTDKKNEQMNGHEFMIQQPSFALSNYLETSTNSVEQTIEKSKLPLLFRVIQFICGITALIIGGALLTADVSFAVSYKNAPGLFWTLGICAPVWMILWIWSCKKSKTVLETDESAQMFSHLNSVSDNIYKELGVPDDAKDVDILSFYYKMIDGYMKVSEKGFQIEQYFNPEFKVFADHENLYLVNLEGKYAFPLSSIVNIHTVKKHIRIAGWNKEEKYNKGIYKQYKLTIDSYGCLHCKSYHILEINHNGESCGIYIPCYELPIFEDIIK